MCKSAAENKIEYNKFKIENITVTRAPLLKIYYWESLNIDEFNKNVSTDLGTFEHDFHYPTQQISNGYLKIVFWLRNWSNSDIELKLKRIKNCECRPQQTRVGFNQFRQLYHCPHRRLIHILQEIIRIQPNEIVALSVVTYFFLYGEHTLTYEISSSDSRIIMMNFHLNIAGFIPEKCILTKDLQPVNVKDYRRFVQPVWVSNITMQHLNFLFNSRDRGLRLLNTNLVVPRQSVWPLMVEYRPSDFENELTINIQFNGAGSKFKLNAKGVMDDIEEESFVPVEDYECADFLYVIYPNKLSFNLELGEERSMMVHVHNFNQKCVEFVWQTYLIKDMFEVTFEPSRFRLKPHHSELCVVKLRVHGKPLNFTRVPAVLEVHRVFDKPTRIARELLTEVESIDDPKWAQDSYLEHVFLHLNIRVRAKKEEEFQLDAQPPADTGKRVSVTKTDNRTIFEKLFWSYLSASNFMRGNKKDVPNETRTYEEVVGNNCCNNRQNNYRVSLNRSEVLETLSQLLAQGLKEISKNWRFVPLDMYYE